jgi:taurine transport system permease protein
MTDLAADNVAVESTPGALKLVRMREFGVGKASTVSISIVTALILISLWWGAAALRLVPHLFLPTPSEVWSAAQSVFADGYANATLWEHVSASLARILIAAAIAVGLGVPIGLLMGLSRWAKGVFDAPIESFIGRCRRSPTCR